MEGPGQLLGYRAMQRNIREQHQLPVPRNLVYDVMTMVDAEGMKRRGNVGKKKKRRGGVGTFTSLVSHTLSQLLKVKVLLYAGKTFLYLYIGTKSYTLRRWA